MYVTKKGKVDLQLFYQLWTVDRGPWTFLSTVDRGQFPTALNPHYVPHAMAIHAYLVRP